MSLLFLEFSPFFLLFSSQVLFFLKSTVTSTDSVLPKHSLDTWLDDHHFVPFREQLPLFVVVGDFVQMFSPVLVFFFIVFHYEIIFFVFVLITILAVSVASLSLDLTFPTFALLFSLFFSLVTFSVILSIFPNFWFFPISVGLFLPLFRNLFSSPLFLSRSFPFSLFLSLLLPLPLSLLFPVSFLLFLFLSFSFSLPFPLSFLEFLLSFFSLLIWINPNAPFLLSLPVFRMVSLLWSVRQLFSLVELFFSFSVLAFVISLLISSITFHIWWWGLEFFITFLIVILPVPYSQIINHFGLVFLLFVLVLKYGLGFFDFLLVFHLLVHFRLRSEQFRFLRLWKFLSPFEVLMDTIRLFSLLFFNCLIWFDLLFLPGDWQ